MRVVEVSGGPELNDYEAHLELEPAVSELRRAVEECGPTLKGRRVWMANSTETGGGVAEMLPRVVSLMRELGIQTEWGVITSEEPRFFDLTKRLHNLIHGVDVPVPTAADRDLFLAENERNAKQFASHLSADDLLVVHDPQPIAMGALLKEELGLSAVWRCHIGVEEITRPTEAAWEFLKPWADAYDRAVFSVLDYVPDYLMGRSEISAPAIDPLGHKNRVLNAHKLAGVLCNASLTTTSQSVLTPPFENPALRLQGDGSFLPAWEGDAPGILYRPTVVQVSRWDRLKGWAPLFDAFVRLKTRETYASESEVHRRRISLTRLVLAGPDPRGVDDDPEGKAVLEELCQKWHGLEHGLQRDIILLVLPMVSQKENALMVNALQRCSSIVVQNSIQEGFGLTATEAMWKGCAVIGTQAAGLRAQIRDGVDGRLSPDAQDSEALASLVDEMLAAPHKRAQWGANAQRRVASEFLVLAQVARWIRILARVAREARI